MLRTNKQISNLFFKNRLKRMIEMELKKTIENRCANCKYFNRLARFCMMNELNKNPNDLCLIYEQRTSKGAGN